MADFSVNQNVLLNVADDLQALQNRLQSSLAALDTSVNKFKEGSAGQAVGSFSAAQMKWSSAMTQMQSALDTARAELLNIHYQYRAGDNRSASMFNSLV